MSKISLYNFSLSVRCINIEQAIKMEDFLVQLLFFSGLASLTP